MKVRQGLLKYISPDTPVEVRLEMARGIEPEEGALRPGDWLTLWFVLGYDKDEEVAGEASKNFREYPAAQLVKALEKKLDPAVLARVVELHDDDQTVLGLVAMNPGVDTPLLERLAGSGPESLLVLIAEDRARLEAAPSVAEAMRKNPNATPELIEALDRGATPGQGRKEGPAEHKGIVDTGEPDEEMSLYQRVQNMSVADKVKLALLGDKSAREILIKDSNKMIASAVLRNPRISEEEVMRIVNAKTTSDDIIRQVSRQKEWLKNYNIRLGMIMNAKTPVPISIKLLPQLNERDLVKVAKSRNIPSVLASNARRIVDKKKR